MKKDNLCEEKDKYIPCFVFPSKEVEERAFEVVRKLYEKEKEGKRQNGLLNRGCLILGHPLNLLRLDF